MKWRKPFFQSRFKEQTKPQFLLISFGWGFFFFFVPLLFGACVGVDQIFNRSSISHVVSRLITSSVCLPVFNRARFHTPPVHKGIIVEVAPIFQSCARVDVFKIHPRGTSGGHGNLQCAMFRLSGNLSAAVAGVALLQIQELVLDLSVCVGGGVYFSHLLKTGGLAKIGCL